LSDATRPGEHVLGSIQVSAEIRAGSETLKIFFTESRLIIAHIGRRGMTDMAGLTLFGKLGARFDGLVRSPKESSRKRKMEEGEAELKPEDILHLHKDNFSVSYTEIVQVNLERTPYSVEIMMLTGDDKYRFSTRENSGKVLQLFRDQLPTRVEVRDRDLSREKMLKHSR